MHKGRLDKDRVLKNSFIKLLRSNGVSPLEIQSRFRFFRQKFESLSRYVDDWFVYNLGNNNQFDDRITELYFIEALLNSNLTLQHLSGTGLDIWIEEISGWGEFVCAHNTEEMDAKNVYGKARMVDFDETILRLTSVLRDKRIKIGKDLDKGVLKEREPIILLISTHCLLDSRPMNAKGDICSFLRALYPISNAFISVNVQTRESSGLQRKYELGVPKKGLMIENDFFLNEENSMISAVVFSYQSIFQQYFSPQILFKSGDDFIVVHNPLARNPISHGLLRCRQEYVCEYEKGKCFSLKNLKEVL